VDGEEETMKLNRLKNMLYDWFDRLSKLRDLTDEEKGRLVPSLLDLVPEQRKVYFLPTFSDTTIVVALKQKFFSVAVLAGMFSFFLEKFLLFFAASMTLQSKFLVSLSIVVFLCFPSLEDFVRLSAWIFGLTP
jgi:hypothetical protein